MNTKQKIGRACMIVGILLILQGIGFILWACFTGRFWRT